MAQDAPQPGRLQHVDAVTRDDLRSVCSVQLSPDGRHLYAGAWQADCVGVYRVDADSGRLEHVQSVVSNEDLAGVTAVRVSSDGRRVAAAAFRARVLTLYKRDPESGRLTVLDAVRGADQPDLGLAWPIDVLFSPDDRFVYLLDPKQSGASATPDAQGSIVVFRVTGEDKLELVEVNKGRDGCFFGCRGMAFHPHGQLGFVASTNSWQLVVVERDRDTGKLTVRQIIQNGAGEAKALAGVIEVACSPDGRFVYASSGRFSGDNAVSVFRVTDEGTLELVQEVVNDQGELRGFVGGNGIVVSSDGKFVSAAATRSGALANFRRDTESGRLTLLETLVHDNFRGKLRGAAGLAVSPNGKFVYVAAEFDQSIEVLKRK